MSAPRQSWMARARAALVVSLRAAASGFPEAGEDGATHIHNARKELKRAASLARLFTPIVGPPAYVALDAVDAARRSVGRARDLDILPGVLATLKCPGLTRDLLMRAIAIERGKARGEHARVDAAYFRAELNEAAAAVAGWDLGAEPLDLLLQSLRLTYRSAKKRGKRAWSSADADDLHDLRSRVVDLGLQLAVFEPAWPALFSAQGAELHRLRQALGDHNDLTVLGEFALARHELSPRASEELIELVLKKRRPLERKASEQFERLFSERPNAFERRIGAYLANPQKKAPLALTSPNPDQG